MSSLDLILIAIVGCFSLFGFWLGFAHAVGSLFGTVLGAVLASRLYAPMGDWLMSVSGWSGGISKIVAFALLFFLVARAISLLFWMAEKTAGFVIGRPFAAIINRILGLLLGLCEGLLTVGLIIYFAERFSLPDPAMQYLRDSFLAPFVSKSASLLLPFLPEAIKMIRSTIEYVR